MTPFRKPPKGYRKFTRPDGVTIELYGEVEIVPGVKGPRTIIATFTNPKPHTTSEDT